MENKKQITFECWRRYDGEWTEANWADYKQQVINKFTAGPLILYSPWYRSYCISLYNTIKDITFDQLCDILKDKKYYDGFFYFDPDRETDEVGHWLEDVKGAMREDCLIKEEYYGDDFDFNVEITDIEG